ncbi:Cytochrome [Abeliophyllum distichum]|uniref:Cytochrome n=1 Tax=Abeliophyllum distichum TaxID=126358 RepID=A0ABD1RU41_9LAMI
MLKELAKLLGTFNPGDYIPWLNWIKRVNGFEANWLDGLTIFFEGVVEEHRNRKKGDTNPNDSSNDTDLVDILLEIQRESNSSSPIETDTIKAVIFDIFAAGTDTTYTALEWAMAELLKHPKNMEIAE